MNYIVYGELSDDHYDHYYDDRDDSFIFNFIESLSQSRYDSEYLKYGSNGWPGRFNAQYEFGASLRVDRITLKAVYSRGVTKHRFYWEDGISYLTHDRKLSISVGYAF